MSEDTLNTSEPPQPEPSPETPPSPPAEASPAVARKRWIAAAAAAVGVALFAVPLLRGPEDHVVADGASGEATTASTRGGAACAAKSSMNFNLTLKDVNGASVRLSDYKGKVVLLNFWATWCGPCKMEIPEFVEAFDKYRDKGFVILGVLSEDDPSQKDLQAFMSEYKMNYPVLRASAELEESVGTLYALPTSFVIDRQGQVCSKHMGPYSREALEREIAGLL